MMGLTAIPVGLLLLLSSAACLHCPPFPSGNCEYEDFSPYISYNDINLFNNSYVNVSNGATLTCHANSTCCSSTYTRIWTNPYNEQVPSDKSMDIYQTLPTEQSVKLHHEGNKDFGVYCCAITCCDKKNICVGLYKELKEMGIDIYTDVLKPDIAAPEYVLRCLSYGSVATFHEWEIDGESYFVRPVVHEVGRKNADYTSTWYLNRSVENVICSAFNDEISTSRVWEYSKYTGTIQRVPVNISAYFDDNSYVHLRWNNSYEENIVKYRISYIGSDGSHGMLEIETSESDVIKESFDTLNFSKCVDYTFEVRAATLEKEAVIALEELESVYDINGFNSSDRNECPSSTQHSLVLKIDSSTLINNSYVDVSNNKDTVISCCSSDEASPHKRWYSPSQPNLSFNEGRCVYEEDSADGNCVELHHPGISEYLGVYCCDTETGEVDDNDRETACVGLYKDDYGALGDVFIEVDLLTEYGVSDPVFVFTCISFGAIATTVEWMQDCQPVCGDGPPVLDLNALESSSRLTVMGNAGIVSCTVSNAKPSSKFAEMDCDSYKGVTIEAPTNVNISYDDEHNGFKCSWSPPNDSSKILRYNLTCEGSDGSLNTWRINKNKTQTVLTGLSQCLSYKVGIRSDSMHSCSEYNYVWINASSICGAAMYKANKCADSHKSPYPFISYNDSILPNNSYVNVHRGGGVTIGCHTNLRTCCNRHAGSGRGDWYDPDGNRLPFYSEGQISQKRMSSQQVNLYHPGSKRSLGVYCCEIETNAVNGCDRESVCVGLYNDDAIKDGAINSAIMTQVKLLSDYNDTNPTVKLTCSSFGGAATTIQWMIDCSPECRNVTQKLESGVESAYDSSIIVHGRVGLVTCNFSNDKPTYKSAEIDFRTYEGINVMAPTNITAQFDNDDIKVTWKIPDHNTKILGYKIVGKGDDGTIRTTTTENGQKANGYLPAMKKCVNYMVGVRSESIYTHSEYSYITIKACEDTFDPSNMPKTFNLTFEPVHPFQSWTNSDAKEIEDSIHSAIRKEVWPKDVTFCCGYFSSNDGDTRVTYTTFVDDCEVLQKINDWRRNTNMLQLGMFLVNLTS